jgi:hypothetical protein
MILFRNGKSFCEYDFWKIEEGFIPEKAVLKLKRFGILLDIQVVERPPIQNVSVVLLIRPDFPSLSIPGHHGMQTIPRRSREILSAVSQGAVVLS